MDNAVIIGRGYVGKATALAFNIPWYYSRSESNITLEEAFKKRFIFICLPTPTIDGKVFTKDIEDMIYKYGPVLGDDTTVIIRSTVPPGFAESLNRDYIVSNPEFLSEATWEEDAKRPWLVVVGGEQKHRERVVGLYKGRFRYSRPIETDNTTAEHIKYALNTFFSLKTIFGNVHYDFAQKVGSNYETVRIALENAPWGSKNHFKIWYKEKRGIHGSCLPKDTEAFATLTASPLFKTILELNKKYE